MNDDKNMKKKVENIVVSNTRTYMHTRTWNCACFSFIFYILFSCISIVIALNFLQFFRLIFSIDLHFDSEEKKRHNNKEILNTKNKPTRFWFFYFFTFILIVIFHAHRTWTEIFVSEFSKGKRNDIASKLEKIGIFVKKNNIWNTQFSDGNQKLMIWCKVLLLHPGRVYAYMRERTHKHCGAQLHAFTERHQIQ